MKALRLANVNGDLIEVTPAGYLDDQPAFSLTCEDLLALANAIVQEHGRAVSAAEVQRTLEKMRRAAR